MSTNNENLLHEKECIPCQGGVPPLALEKRRKLLKELHGDWNLVDEGKKLFREYKFKDFADSLNLVNAISKLAEDQWHHPDICFGYGYLRIHIWTHKINSLVESDFILASKIDQL